MFDPLHKWLGIPPSEQPPSDYRLLGLVNYEDDPDVIDVAADRDLTFLHDLTNGEHGDLAEELSNRISAARLKLLNKEKKAAYDAELRAAQDAEIDIDSVIDSLGSAAQSSATGNTPATGNASEILGMPQGMTTPTAAGVPPQDTHTAAPVPRSALQPAAAAAGARQPSGPLVSARSPRGSAKRKRPSVIWALGILPGLVVLGYLLFSIWTGRLHLDPSKLEKLGVSPEQAAILAGDSKQDPSHDPTSTQEVAESRTVSPSVDSNTSTSTATNRLTTNAPTNSTRPMGGKPANSVPTTTPSVTLPSGSMTPAITPPNSPSLAEYLTASAKQSIPSPASIDEKMQTVRELYHEEYLDAKNRDEKIAVADKMRDTAGETKNDPEGQYALYRVARDIYLREGEFEQALEIIDLLDESFHDLDVASLKAEILSTVARPAARSKEFASECLSLVYDCIESGQIHIGMSVCQTLRQRLVRLTSDQALSLKHIEQQLSVAKSLFDNYERNATVLESDPTDADAQFAAGKYFCLVENRWDDGVARLATGSHPLYRNAALQELSASRPEVTVLQIADSWFEVFESSETHFERVALKEHIKRFYEAAKPKTSGLEETKIDLRLETLDGVISFGERPTGPRLRTKRDALALAKQEARNRELGSLPRVVQSRTYDSSASTDFASIRGNTIYIGMGNSSSGSGEVAAGVEFENVGTIVVQGAASHSTMTTSSSTSKVGFVIDYHTGSSYTKRVFLNFGTNTPSYFDPNPPWGTAQSPDDRDFLPVSANYTIALEKWAPNNWDGRCWFSVYMQNAGMNRELTATLSWKARPNN